jgi:nicotinate-nucleotide pyrophosphorylase (carboxylating)
MIDTTISPNLMPWQIEDAVRQALAEDFGRGGDITSQSTIPADRRTQAVLASRADGVVAGLDCVRAAFALVDPDLCLDFDLADGARVVPGSVIGRVGGSARSMLGAERVALNFLGHLSGIASATAELAALIAAHPAQIVDTRKTTPGLRALEKAAVRAGGGRNHRLGLDDAVLIKDNHVAVAGGIAPAIAAARQHIGHLVKIEVEVDTLAQADEALAAGVDAILFDNMPPAVLAEGVAMAKGRCITEASGGITRDTIAAIAATGVDLISVGWITHSAPSLDVGLDIAA